MAHPMGANSAAASVPSEPHALSPARHPIGRVRSATRARRKRGLWSSVKKRVALMGRGFNAIGDKALDPLKGYGFPSNPRALRIDRVSLWRKLERRETDS